MTNFPKITVVTPNRNQGRFLEATIQSVLLQEYPNLEYIIIDGGSSDESLRIIEKYRPRLSFSISEPDNGQYDAVQKGFQRSSGDIMTYLNSDDTLSHKSLFTVAQLFSDYPQIEWLGGVPNHIDEDGRSIWVGNHARWNRYRYLNFDFEYIQQEGTFWSRGLWNKSGSYISHQFRLASDMELWSRFFEHADYYAIPGILGSFRLRSQDQKSLEGMDTYTKEARTILAGMRRTAADEKILQTARSLPFRLFRRAPFRKLFALMNYQSIEDKVFRFAPLLRFNRSTQKYELVPATEIQRPSARH